MSGGSQKPLTKGDVEALLARLDNAVTRRECRSCECLQGFFAQMALDAEEDAKRLPAQRQVMPKRMHACLGCEPCRPAEIFAEYLLGERES